MWGVQSDFASPFAQSGWVQFLESGEGCTNDSLSIPDYPPLSSEFRFCSWAESDSYWCAEDGFSDGRVELFQLVKEVQPLLGLFYNGLNVIVPLQVLRNCGVQEPEWLHCSHSAVYDGEWGESRGVSPEVHDYLHSFERGERTHPLGAPVLIVLDENFPSLTSCCLSVRKLVIHWQVEVGTERCVSLFWRVSGMVVLQAKVY